MVQKSLSDLAIQNLKTEGYYWDKLPGFGIRIGKNRKTFISVRGGRRTTLGVYPHLSLTDARQLATLALYGSKTATSVSIKSSKVLEAYLKQLAVKERTKNDYERLLNKHFKKELGTKSINKITTTDILAITDKLSATPAERHHCHAAMQTFFNWCVPRYIPTSPMAGLKNPSKPNERKRVLTDDEIKAVWKAGVELGNYGTVVRLILLLGLRKSETVSPKSVNETTCTFLDTKNGTDHTLPITPYSRKLLQAVTYTNGWSKNFEKLKEKSAMSGFTLHDMRRTVGTRLNCDPWLVDRILGHQPPKLHRIYNQHDFTEQMRKPLKEHEDWLLNLIES
jgi:integrase